MGNNLSPVFREPTSSASFAPDYFAMLNTIEDRHFWFRARREIILACLQRFVPNLTHARILEIGCGNGNVLNSLKEAKCSRTLIGGDLFSQGLWHCRQRVGVPLVQFDTYCLPFSQSLDVIGMFDVLEHLPQDEAVLKEVFRALRPEGHLIITVPAHQFLWSYFDDFSHHQRRYSKKQLAQKLQQTGFKVEFLSYYMLTILPFILLRRWLPSSQRSDDHSSSVVTNPADLKVYPVLNECLFGLTRAEKSLLLRRALPFGASLVVVARK